MEALVWTIFKSMSAKSDEKIKKVFCEILAHLGLKITAQSNL